MEAKYEKLSDLWLDSLVKNRFDDLKTTFTTQGQSNTYVYIICNI